MSEPGPVSVRWEAGLAVVTFDAPPLNLFDEVLGEALSAALDELESSHPRAVLFRADGKVFTGGVDVHLFAAQQSGEQARPLLDRLLTLATRVDRLPCPTVFGAHALTLTWAFELALACDIILASVSAKFGLVERRVGLTPTMGGPQRLAERAGSARAKEIVMTGELFTAASLEAWNVVNRVLPVEGFDDAVRAFAQDLADGPTLAHAATKQLVRHATEAGVEQANAHVLEIVTPLFDSEDLKVAVQAFLTSGPQSASFNGR
jgi:enoyl-CoA hydratase/carnithine racemase